MPDGLTWKILVETFGPSGVILGLGVVTLWKVLPWLQTYLVAQAAAMERIANSVEQLVPRMDRVERLTDDMSRDMVALFHAVDRRQPSTTARHASQARRAQDRQP